MNLRFYRQMKMEGGGKIRVPQRFEYDDFGVRKADLAISGKGACINGPFVCTGVPGTGFFQRDSDSEKYQKFVNDCFKQLKTSLADFIFDRQFSFDKEIALAISAKEATKDHLKQTILESYVKCLKIAREAYQCEQVVRGVKHMMGNHPTKRYTSLISHARGRIHELKHELNDNRLNALNCVSEETMNHYHKFCSEFMKVLHSRRGWDLVKHNGKVEMKRVFWDMGMFDYIITWNDTPIMRDWDGTCYYIYPTHILKVRSTVDFDMYSLKDIHVEFEEVAGDSLVSQEQSLEHMMGRKLGKITIPEMNFEIYFRHRSVAHQFMDALQEYQAAVFGK